MWGLRFLYQEAYKAKVLGIGDLGAWCSPESCLNLFQSFTLCLWDESHGEDDAEDAHKSKQPEGSSTGKNILKKMFKVILITVVVLNYWCQSKLRFNATRNTHHHVLEGFGHKERHAPVGKYTHGTGKPSRFDRENFWHDQPRDWTPTESKA